MFTVLIFSILLASAMAYFFEKTTLRPDTIISFSFTGSVALGVIILGMLGKYRMIDGILFGSIYANDTADLYKQLALLILILAFTLWKLRPYTLAILQPDLARIQGVNTSHLNYFFAILIAITITLTLKMAGALLISALIVTPAAASKMMAKNFRHLLLLSPLLGFCAAGSGVLISYQLDSPTGPTIVLTNVAVLLLCLIVTRFKK